MQGPIADELQYAMLIDMDTSVLYVIVCASPPAQRIDHLVRLAQERGWDVCVLTTPSARRFVNVDDLERLTGHPVRSEYKHPEEPDVLPPADAVIVAPATVNTINKWAAGICDTLALGIIVEGIGLKLPIVAVPYSNDAHMAHPAFTESIARLTSWGVRVVKRSSAQDGEHADDGIRSLWEVAVAALEVHAGRPANAAEK